MTDIEKLKELEAKATKGPWSLVDNGRFLTGPYDDLVADCDYFYQPGSEENTALIVAMRNAPPALLDAAELTSRAREDALREAGAKAKTAWLHYPRGEIGDADHDSALCEYVAERIALIDKPKDAPAPLPAAPVDGGKDA